MALDTDVSAMKLFSLLMTCQTKKLECLSLALLFSPNYYLGVRPQPTRVEKCTPCGRLLAI
jgi:hypothetical protein